MTNTSDDLVERLISNHSDLSGDDYWLAIHRERSDAAAEITSLRAKLAAAEADAIGAENARQDVVKELSAAETKLAIATKALEEIADMYAGAYGYRSQAIAKETLLAIKGQPE